MARGDAEERIKHFVEFVMPVAAAVSFNNTAASSTLENPNSKGDLEAISARMERAYNAADSIIEAQNELFAQVEALRREKAAEKAAVSQQFNPITTTMEGFDPAAQYAAVQSTRNLYEKFSHRRFPVTAQRILRPSYLRNSGSTINSIIPQTSRTNSRWRMNL